jgi:hypothetical protein
MPDFVSVKFQWVMSVEFDLANSRLFPLTPVTSRYNHRKNKHVIAFEIYGKGNNQCAKKKEDTYIMDVGQFSRAYVAQKQIDYNLQGNKYGNPGSMDYLECTQVQYNDAYESRECWHLRAIHFPFFFR